MLLRSICTVVALAAGLSRGVAAEDDFALLQTSQAVKGRAGNASQLVQHATNRSSSHHTRQAAAKSYIISNNGGVCLQGTQPYIAKVLERAGAGPAATCYSQAVAQTGVCSDAGYDTFQGNDGCWKAARKYTMSGSTTTEDCTAEYKSAYHPGVTDEDTKQKLIVQCSWIDVSDFEGTAHILAKVDVACMEASESYIEQVWQNLLHIPVKPCWTEAVVTPGSCADNGYPNLVHAQDCWHKAVLYKDDNPDHWETMETMDDMCFGQYLMTSGKSPEVVISEFYTYAFCDWKSFHIAKINGETHDW